MSQYEESGIKFNFAGIEHFRMSEVLQYISEKADGLKEIDFSWTDGSSIYHLEIKNYEMKPDIKRLQEGLLGKTRHTLLVMAAVWARTKTV